MTSRAITFYAFQCSHLTHISVTDKYYCQQCRDWMPVVNTKSLTVSYRHDTWVISGLGLGELEQKIDKCLEFISRQMLTTPEREQSED